MKLGVRIPYQGATRGEDVIAVAQAAEQIGFEAGFVGDHTVWPVEQTGFLNPSTATGKYPKPPDEPNLGAWTTLAFAAGATKTLRLGVGVTILAHRNPVLFAKEVASLDHLSGGRTICGLGLGWMAEEFDALGVSFKRRRIRLEEGVAALRRLWEDREAEFHGAEFDFGPVYCEPKPMQNPLPIWLGGHSPPALERAARLADGWYGSFLTPDTISPLITQLRADRRGSPRAHIPFTIAVSRTVAWADDPPGFALSGALLALADIPAAMTEYRQAGVDMLIFDTLRQRPADLIQVMRAATTH